MRQYLATDHTSERDFDLNSELIPVGAEKEMYHSATADITSWFPSGGLPALGIGFVKTKYYNPSDVSQPTDNTAEQIARYALCAATPLCPWTVYIAGGSLNINKTHTNPPDEFTPCVFDFGWVWLDIEYYPSS